MNPDLRARIPSVRRKYRKGNHGLLPVWELLEERRLLATMNWAISSGGDWDVASNWVNSTNPSDHHVPTASDTAVIGALGSGVSITHSAGTDAVQSVSSGTNLILTGGTLQVAGDL